MSEINHEEESAWDKAVRQSSVERVPILISEHAIVLLTIFELKHDNLRDLWSWDFLQTWGTPERAAQQFVAQLTEGGHYTPALLMELRAKLLDVLKRDDAVFGSDHATKTP